MTTRFARVLLFSTAFCVYITDRVAKLFALKALHPGESIKVLPGIFHLTLVLNNGAAFGLLRDWAAFFIVISTVVVTAIIVYAWRRPITSAPLAVSLGLMLGGALGNLVDRITYGGRVVDFLDFRIWPVFNIADSAITVGVTMLILTMFLTKR